MTCQITIRTTDSETSDVAVPLTAIYAPAEGGTYVWVVEGDKVRLQAVVLGDIFGRDMVRVSKGLLVGDVVVSAGVYRLENGQSVRIINR